jgi:hypothetical protein
MIHCAAIRAQIYLLESAGQEASSLKPFLSNCDEVVTAQCEEEKALPSFFIRGINFAGAMARWARAGMPRRTQSEISERLAICEVCPQLHNNHCQLCGCACTTEDTFLNKLALSTEKCPIEKW